MKAVEISIGFVKYLKSPAPRYRWASRIPFYLDRYVVQRTKVVNVELPDFSERIAPALQPLRSPDDNVIERGWVQIYDNVMRNHRHRSIDSLVEAERRSRNHAKLFSTTLVSAVRTVK